MDSLTTGGYWGIRVVGVKSDGLLVLVGSTGYPAYTSSLSTW